MKLTKIVVCSIVLLLLVSSFVVFMQQTQNPTFSTICTTLQGNPLFFNSPIHLTSTEFTTPQALNQTTRSEIYNFVKANPGIHFRGICSGLCIPIGVAQYHLGILTKTGLISFFKDGRYKRYFRSKNFGAKKMQIISVLRHSTARRILCILTENNSVAHHDLASKLEISSQALSWQMKRLREMEIVDSESQSLEVLYSVNEENTMLIQCCLVELTETKKV